MEHGKKEQQGKYWKYYTKKQGFLATCNICFNDYSFRSSSTNLAKHLSNKHGIDFVVKTVVDNDSDGETNKKPNKKEGCPTMTYYEVVDSEKSEIKCKLCEKRFSHDAVEDLQNHIKEEHEEQPVEEDCDDKDPGPVQNRARYWKFYTKKNGFLATCKICKQDYSYRSSVTNLAKHLKNKHGVDYNSAHHENVDSDSETET